MKILDVLALLVQKVLGILPPGGQRFLWFPLFLVALLVLMHYGIRRALPLLGRAAVQVVRMAVISVGAVLLVPDFLVATTFRMARIRPPGVVYAYGDAVTGAMIGTENLATKASSGFKALPKINFFFIIVFTGLWLWAWDARSCGDAGNTECSKPITQWVQGLK